MAHFAKLNQNNIILQVDVVSNDVIDNLPFPDSEPLGVLFMQSIYGTDTIWKQTSYSGSFRIRYAGINYIFDPNLDAFLYPKPYPSWVLNPQTYEWEAPVSYPTDGKKYVWDEATLSWVPAVLPADQPTTSGTQTL